MTPTTRNRRNDGLTPLRFLFIVFFFFFFFFTLAGAQSDNRNNQNDPNYYNRFSPSMAIIVVILIAALFLMGFFSIYIRHCSDSPSTTARNLAAAATGRSRRGPRGLDRHVIDSFPTLEYSVVKVHKIGKGALECAVCLNEFEETETLRLIPKCDHVFHPECIDEWLSLHTTCPVCRANLVPQPGESLHGFVPDLSGDVEAQNDAVGTEQENQNPENDNNNVDGSGEVEGSKPELLSLNNNNNNNNTLNRNRTRGSRSGRPRRFPRSHSTGHSVVQPGEDTERFTLRLPEEVRKQIIMNPALNRARSLVILPREGSSRRGYRTGGDGSSRGARSFRRSDRGFKSDRWVFTMAPPFLVRASSIRSPRVANSAANGEGSSAANAVVPHAQAAAAAAEVARLPV